MNQKSAGGLSLLDAAKSAIEYFVKKRNLDQLSRDDKYYLVTCDEVQTSAIKVGLKDDTFNEFLQIVKMLQAYDFTDIGTALKRGFDFVNLNRFVSQVDNLARGRRPYVLDPVAVIVLTDGGVMTNKEGVVGNVALSASDGYPGSEFFQDLFRWDQRVYSISLRFPGVTTNATQIFKDFVPPISNVCEATGDNSSASRVLVSMEPAASPISIEEFGAPKQHHQFISFKSGPKIWPIPEDYFVNVNSSSILPRMAIPVIRYKLNPISLPLIPKEFPCDLYLLEGSTLVDWLIDCAQKTGKSTPIAFECAVLDNVDQSSSNVPFGFLYVDPSLKVVVLYVLPFNYTCIFQILNSWTANLTQRWKIDFERYLLSIPTYYIPLIKNALSSYPVGIFSEKLLLDFETSIKLQENLQSRLKLAEKEIGRLSNAIFQNRNENSKSTQNVFSVLSNEDLLRTPRSEILSLLESLSHYLVGNFKPQEGLKSLRIDGDSVDSDVSHRVPIVEMGDYFSYLKKNAVNELRSINDQQDYWDRKTSNVFGGIFARKSSTAGFVDEADMIIAQSSQSKKRSYSGSSSQIQFLKKKKEALKSPLSDTELSTLPNVNKSTAETQTKVPSEQYNNLITVTANSPASLLNINKANNTLKLKIFSAIRTPYKVDIDAVRNLYSQIRGEESCKRKYLDFIHYTLKLYRKDFRVLAETLMQLESRD